MTSPSESLAVPKRVWSSTGWRLGGRLYGSACTLAILWFATQSLGDAEFGRMTFYLALLLILDGAVDLGTGNAAVQCTSSSPERVPGIVAVGRRIRIVTAAIGALIVGGYAYLQNEPDWQWIAVASLYPLTHALGLSALVFWNRIAWGVPVAVRALASTLSLVFAALMLQSPWKSAGSIVFAVAAGSTLGNITLHFVSRKQARAGSGEREPLGPFLQMALPMGLAGLCQQLYFHIDNVFLRHWHSDEVIGDYNLGVRVMSWSIALALFSSGAALPWLKREREAGRLGPALTRLGQPGFALAGLATGILWPYTGDVLGLFGESHRGGAEALNWLLLAGWAVYLGAPLMTGLVAAGRNADILRVAVVSLMVNLTLCALWVPEDGILGAARSTVATEGLVAVLAAVNLARAGHAPVAGRRTALWLLGPAGFVIGIGLTRLIGS
jgi:O-antigen/teichoic acid export membrane protein